jgi:hypothetical protein
MEPITGLGISGYFRGLREAFTYKPKLSNNGSEGNPHPADIFSGYLAALTVSLLNFRESNEWAQVIESETYMDVTTIVIENREIDSTICKTLFRSLENHSFRVFKIGIIKINPLLIN